MSNKGGNILIGIIAIGLAAVILGAIFTPPGQRLLQRIEAQMRQVAKKIKKHVRSGKRNREIRRIAWSLIQDLDNEEKMGIVSRIHQYATKSVGYMNDPWGIELVSPPEETAYVGAGDCDCKATFLSTLLEAAGIKSYVVIVKPQVDVPRVKVIADGHVFVAVPIDKKDIDAIYTYNPQPGFLALRSGEKFLKYLLPLEASTNDVSIGWLSNATIRALREYRYIIADPDTSLPVDYQLRVTPVNMHI